jgi:hypothetical protein
LNILFVSDSRVPSRLFSFLIKMLSVFAKQLILLTQKLLFTFKQIFLRCNDLSLLKHLLPADQRLILQLGSRSFDKIDDQENKTQVENYATE